MIWQRSVSKDQIQCNGYENCSKLHGSAVQIVFSHLHCYQLPMICDLTSIKNLIFQTTCQSKIPVNIEFGAGDFFVLEQLITLEHRFSRKVAGYKFKILNILLHHFFIFRLFKFCICIYSILKKCSMQCSNSP